MGDGLVCLLLLEITNIPTLHTLISVIEVNLSQIKWISMLKPSTFICKTKSSYEKKKIPSNRYHFAENNKTNAMYATINKTHTVLSNSSRILHNNYLI